MKVVVAVDSFKGSMTSMEAGMAVKAGVLAAHKDAEVIVKPLADGGEGTTDALIEGLNGERIDVTVTGPYHEPVNAYYGYLKDTNTAIMEMASAAGITISDQKDPMTATTFGVGEMILDAIAEESAISLSESAEVLPMMVESECSVPLVSPSLTKTEMKPAKADRHLLKSLL